MCDLGLGCPQSLGVGVRERFPSLTGRVPEEVIPDSNVCNLDGTLNLFYVEYASLLFLF